MGRCDVRSICFPSKGSSYQLTGMGSSVPRSCFLLIEGRYEDCVGVSLLVSLRYCEVLCCIVKIGCCVVRVLRHSENWLCREFLCFAVRVVG